MMNRLEKNRALLLLETDREFIAQARTLRDLWSGSLLLGWLMAQALRKLITEFGSEAIVSPCLRRQPLLDWLATHERPATLSPIPSVASRSEPQEQLDRALTPSLPNRLLALVPTDYDVEGLVRALEAEWKRIAEQCWLVLNDRCPFGPDTAALWQFQVQNFLDITWQLWPLGELAAIVQSSLPPELRSHASQPSQSPSVRDGLAAGQLEPDHDWAAHYALLVHRHEARRQTCAFRAWPIHHQIEKDPLGGQVETILDTRWLEQAQESTELRDLFSQGERLGAVNVIKRVWPKAWLEPRGLGCPRFETAKPECAALLVLESGRIGRPYGGSGPTSLPEQLQWSEALANFGVHCAPRLIAAHGGRLIYALGEEVLAVLPAKEAIACACGLRLGFQGSSVLATAEPWRTHFAETQDGFVQFKPVNRTPDAHSGLEPAGPLHMPGTALPISVGLALASKATPLAEMVRAARNAAQQARIKLGHEALWVTVLDRNGCGLQWGSRFAAKGVPLLQSLQGRSFQAISSARPVSDTFEAKGLLERLAKLRRQCQAFARSPGQTPTALTAGPRGLVDFEVVEALSDRPGDVSSHLVSLCREYLCELEQAGQSLNDFDQLLALAAFLAQPGP